MLNKLMPGAVLLSALFLLVGCMASKKNHEQRLYLQGIDSLKYKELAVPVPVIKKGDLLTILVYSDSKDATELFNQPQGGSTGGAMGGNSSNLSSTGRGYQVDENGQIYFHSLGLLKVEGMTKSELAVLLRDKLKVYLQNPYVTVRYTNARVTVLGEVAKPGVIELPDQKVSILDVLGWSGDLTPFGRRDNILVVREIDGQRVTGRLDIRSSDIYGSPFFYLQQNDMVYIEPNRRKPTGNEQVLTRNIAIGTSVLSVIAIIASLIAR
ncbi:polysaccharide biosynthesis/export family protein [Flavihumibacter rivuli]|uniref:polysaccharide biosynthesis/export family protein n=1 Tax=Flavihumibacter rivuli TaxID=2838156 RepID=UPI001BDE7A56|nr:polysaccharide biosynthesis/export family protein [Flavihumibacter rivuli]ULQ56247.1 polysaccharide biosynthesis/export family protein [Flavihumibacter rivuli]